jgi:hypothetical protein
MGNSPTITITVTAAPLMPTDLSMWDMNPKSGSSPLTCTWVGYLIVPGYDPIYQVFDGETVSLQRQNADGTWSETGQTTKTGPDPTNSAYHGYFSGTITLPTTPGTYVFRVHYAGSASKGLEGCDDNAIPIVLSAKTGISLTPILVVAGVAGAVAISAGAYYATRKHKKL